jgi:D-3-phosphoglycerate dehydrogenase
MADYLARGTVSGAINIADLPRDMSPRDRAYADLAGRMGSLLSVLCGGGVDRVTVTTHGDGLAHLAAALRRFATAALLGPYFENRINIVNADAVAAEHGIDIRHETRAGSRGGRDHLLVTAEADGERREIEGTIDADGGPRILRIDGYQMNMAATGDMVLIHNDDRPGVIGLVGTVFGDHNVNIADMTLSRHAGRALMVLKLDGPAPGECLKALEGHEAILSVRTARLGGA